MTKGKVKFITLGCRVNQYDTQAMRESLLAQGFEQAGKDNKVDQHEVDLVVINTCTVTHDADRDSRYWMRRARKAYPKAKIVVTGCGVTRNRAEIEALPEVDLVLMNEEKADIASLSQGCGTPRVQETGDRKQETGVRHSRNIYAPLQISRTEGIGRAFVKIQDGCNHACSFCKVVMARGRSRSRPLQDITAEVLRLRDAGYKEMVFAGIQLGAYGLDFNLPLSLTEVLEQCSKIEGIERLRLSSIEPLDVRSELIQALKHLPKCVPHLHIPLQSGDDQVLKKMNRRYGREYYQKLIGDLKNALPDFGLSLDVMAGFPGETEQHFENTLDLLRLIGPVKTHVFPYSQRDGTRAASYEDLPPELIRSRVEHLIRLGERLAIQYKKRFLGRKMEVLVEQMRPAQNGGPALLHGLTANFMKVVFPGPERLVSKIVPVILERLEGESVFGVLEMESSLR